MTTRIVIVGGFLGAGKTTLLLRAAEKLTQRGYRVGLVTNDQGEDLVDTALGQEASVPVVEVAGGCFCCRFPDLLTSLQHLQDVVKPDLILAEPVGSCTDLVSTVLRPLVQFYGEQYELAPLTVLHDASRAIDDFSPDVRYLYQQQLAEAELILLSKSDLLSPQELKGQETSVQATFPQARIQSVSASNGQGLDTWLDVVLGQASANPEALVIDYERYAQAEATLGWLNAKGQIRSSHAYSLRQWTTDLLTNLASLCTQHDSPIAHIKTMVTTTASLPQSVSPVPSHHPARLKASLTDAGSKISWDLESEVQETRGHEFILNVRVSSAPEQLQQMTMQAIEQAKPFPSARYYLEQMECFSPSTPEPHYRL